MSGWRSEDGESDGGGSAKVTVRECLTDGVVVVSILRSVTAGRLTGECTLLFDRGLVWMSVPEMSWMARVWLEPM